jgi:uncharacterized protein (DUF58 family)
MKDRRPITYTATLVRKRPSLDFSVAGLVYCSMMMFMGLAALNSQANLLFGVFGLMIGVLMFSLMFSRTVLRRLVVRRLLPDIATVGRPCVISYEIQNAKRYWPSMSVTLAEMDGVEAFARQPHAYMLHAAGGMTAIVPAEVLPRRRGTFKLNEFQLSTSFPFGFVKRAIDQRQSDTLLVYPAIGHVDQRLLQLFTSAESTGMTMRPRPGGEDEFYGVKEYREGENPRRIYWRRSARAGTLVAREMTHVSPPRLLLVVDTCLGDASPERLENIERAIAIAASVADAALEGEMPVGLFAPNRGEFARISPNRGKRHRRDILTALAQLELSDKIDRSALLAAVRPLTDKATTLVLCTPDAGESSRGGPIILSGDPSTRQWVTFGPETDFQLAAQPREAVQQATIN